MAIKKCENGTNISQISNDKGCGPSEVSAELLKPVGEYEIDSIYDITKDAWNREKIQNGVMDKMLRDIVDIDEMGCGFTKGRGTTGVIWIVRQMQQE